jgi:hypothetical protein
MRKRRPILFNPAPLGVGPELKAARGKPVVRRIELDSDEMATKLTGCDERGAGAAEYVEDETSFVGKALDERRGRRNPKRLPQFINRQALARNPTLKLSGLCPAMPPGGFALLGLSGCLAWQGR